MYKLYSVPGTCSTGILVLMKKLNVPVEVVLQSDVENYSDTVSSGQVPAIHKGEFVLTEAAVIAMYLLEEYGEIPVDPAGEEDIHQFRRWLLFCNATIHPAYTKLFTATMAMRPSEKRERFRRFLADRVSAVWKVVDDRLATRRYMFGDAPSIIDYQVALYTTWVNWESGIISDLDFTYGSNTERLVAEILALPEYVAALEAEAQAERDSAERRSDT